MTTSPIDVNDADALVQSRRILALRAEEGDPDAGILLAEVETALADLSMRASRAVAAAEARAQREADERDREATAAREAAQAQLVEETARYHDLLAHAESVAVTLLASLGTAWASAVACDALVRQSLRPGDDGPATMPTRAARNRLRGLLVRTQYAADLGRFDALPPETLTTTEGVEDDG